MHSHSIRSSRLKAGSGCVTTIIRLQSLLVFRISIDPTWDYVPVTIWTELELGCGFVCVSLPSVRILFNVILPKSFPNFFALITSRSRARTTPPPVERQQRKGFSLLNVPNSHLDSGEHRNLGSSGWSQLRSAQNSGSQQVESHVDNHPANIPIVSPGIAGIRRTSKRDEWDPLDIVRSPRQSCPSCGGAKEYITALPQIGCLPDGACNRESRERSARNIV